MGLILVLNCLYIVYDRSQVIQSRNASRSMLWLER